jgi:hypothetical protein
VELLLTRLPGSGAATAGDLEVGSKALFTLELPWLNNEPDKSCVPVGRYELVPYDSPTHGPTWCLRNPDLKIMGCDVLSPDQVAAGYRSFCEFHAANWARQLRGCIALGLDDQPLLDPLTGLVEPAIERSRDAIVYLISVLGRMATGHVLTIENLQLH